MARYYFHLHDRSGRTDDAQGCELDDPGAVRERALKEARGIICDDVRQGRIDLTGRIEVTDGGGRVVLTLPFSDAVVQG